jgi:putative ABC transport system permease protein
VDPLAPGIPCHLSKSAAPAPVVPANYELWRKRASSYEQIAGWRFVYFNLSGAVSPMRVVGFRVEPAFFGLLGVSPLVGRDFDRRERLAGNDRVVLLTNGFWQRQFGGNPDVVGRQITVDGDPCTVVGILPQTFRFFHVLNREIDVWRPLSVDRPTRFPPRRPA